MSQTEQKQSTKDKTDAGTERDPIVKKKFGLRTVKFSFNKEVEKPKFEENKSKGWFNYGEKNLFPDFLLGAYFKSGKHNSIINRKIKMIAGKGFEKPKSKPAIEAIINPFGTENGNRTAKLCASDQEIFKGFALWVRWNAKRTKVAAYDYLPFHNVRKGVEEDIFFFSKDWSSIQKKENKPIKYHAFDPSRKLPKDFKSLKEEEQEFYLTEIAYFQDVSVGSDAYPIPNYFSSMEWILTDNEVGKFSYNLAKKNFLGGFHIGFNNGIPEDEERQQAKKDFKDEYGGTSGEDIIVTFSEPDSEGVDFNPLPSAGNENIFENTEKRAQENIFIAHEVVNPILFGIKTEGQLGGRDELEESLSIFQAVYIDDKQESLETVFNSIFKAMGVDEILRLQTYTLVVAVEEAVEEPKDVEAEARAALKGSVGGVQGILAVQAAVSSGTTEPDAGAAILELIFGLSPEEAKRMLAIKPNTEE